MGTIEKHGKKKDLRRIRFTMPDGSRQRLNLGKLSMQQVREVNQNVENIIASAKSGVPLSNSTSIWLDDASEDLRSKLEALGLIERRANCHIGGFTQDYIESRSDIKPRTNVLLTQTRKKIIECFGEYKNLKDFNQNDAEKFRIYLRETGLSEATTRRHCGRARQFFNSAIKKELIKTNPFGEIAVTVNSNRERMHYVTIEEAEKTLEALPNAEWRALFALCRFGGLRCPSEVMLVSWQDIHWDSNRMTVHSPKTEHHAGGESRIIPLFPELRKYLSEWQEYAPDESTYVIHNIRTTGAYLNKMFRKYIASAGVKPWEKLFQNMRATRQTELSDHHPIKAVCDWMGNSQDVAKSFYLQTTSEHFEKAIDFEVLPSGQNQHQNSPAIPRKEEVQLSVSSLNNLENKGNESSLLALAGDCKNQFEPIKQGKLPPEGLEPSTY